MRAMPQAVKKGRSSAEEGGAGRGLLVRVDLAVGRRLWFSKAE
jgi:hypothetical protein